VIDYLTFGVDRDAEGLKIIPLPLRTTCRFNSTGCFITFLPAGRRRAGAILDKRQGQKALKIKKTIDL
jgi:hypothetical protein